MQERKSNLGDRFRRNFSDFQEVSHLAVLNIKKLRSAICQLLHSGACLLLSVLTYFVEKIIHFLFHVAVIVSL